MLPKKILKQTIDALLRLSNDALKTHLAQAKKKKLDLEKYIIDEGIIDEVELYNKAAEIMEVPFVTLKGTEMPQDAVKMIPPALAETHKVVAFQKDEKELHIAMLDPTDIQTVEFIKRKIGLKIKVFLTSPTDIKQAMRYYHADLESEISISEVEEEKEGELKKAATELPIINIVRSILEHAVFENASDIHIEPVEKEVIVRYRVDGVLRNVMSLPKKVQNGIIARIKILSNLKIDEHMVPQDGRFKIKVNEDALAFRVSIIPVYDGEKIVMRLLHEGQKPLTLDQLGFQPKPKALVESAIKKPHGMILVTGPTGSGKTTTLYSLLGILNQPNVNISTIEDPIEYHIKGINQSQVNPRVGFKFADGLRAFLRQDPDIIMVGEIRDQETAEIAMHAAMTGHLVLSTLHTNDAPTTLPRLMDMNIPPFLIAFTTNIIVAQRLVRRICEHCKKEFTLEKRAVTELEKMFDVKKLKALFSSHNLKLAGKESGLHNIKFYHGEGCRRCGDSGYKGRIGIYEVLEIDKKIIDLINGRANAEDIKRYATESGMITMLQDGLIKAKQGMTTIEEILRVTKN